MDNLNEPLSLEKMRESRTNHESVFIQFVQEKKFHSSHAFCFYEGEDSKYYDVRIREKFENNFITYIVGNKAEVIKLLDMINKSEVYYGVCVMFFVDRDFDKSIAGCDEKLFETPCYSIENLYANIDCLKKILQSEFFINIVDDDFSKCLKDYNDRHNEFCEYMLEFNALLLLNKELGKEKRTNTPNKITHKLVHVDIIEVVKSDKYSDTITKLRESIGCSDEEIENAKKALVEKGDYTNSLRGKNQLDFFCDIVMNLKELNRKGEYFSKKRDRVHLTISGNRLSELSQYAITPKELDVFLENNRKKLETNIS